MRMRSTRMFNTAQRGLLRFPLGPQGRHHQSDGDPNGYFEEPMNCCDPDGIRSLNQQRNGQSNAGIAIGGPVEFILQLFVGERKQGANEPERKHAGTENHRACPEEAAEQSAERRSKSRAGEPPPGYCQRCIQRRLHNNHRGNYSPVTFRKPESARDQQRDDCCRRRARRMGQRGIFKNGRKSALKADAGFLFVVHGGEFGELKTYFKARYCVKSARLGMIRRRFPADARKGGWRHTALMSAPRNQISLSPNIVIGNESEVPKNTRRNIFECVSPSPWPSPSGRGKSFIARLGQLPIGDSIQRSGRAGSISRRGRNKFLSVRTIEKRRLSSCRRMWRL